MQLLFLEIDSWFRENRDIYCSSLITDTRVHILLSSFSLCLTAQAASSASEQLDEISYPPVYWEREVLKYFRFSSILMVLVDRCSKRRLPGLVSSLYSCRLTLPHYITIRLPLKVILPEHNHTQSKPQTSYIKETVNSLRIYFILPQKCFRSIHKLKLWWLELRFDAT